MCMTRKEDREAGDDQKSFLDAYDVNGDGAPKIQVIWQWQCHNHACNDPT